MLYATKEGETHRIRVVEEVFDQPQSAKTWIVPNRHEVLKREAVPFFAMMATEVPPSTFKYTGSVDMSSADVMVAYKFATELTLLIPSTTFMTTALLSSASENV